MQDRVPDILLFVRILSCLPRVHDERRFALLSVRAVSNSCVSTKPVGTEIDLVAPFPRSFAPLLARGSAWPLALQHDLKWSVFRASTRPNLVYMHG